MAATQDLVPDRKNGTTFGYKVKGAVRIFRGSIVALTAAGLAVPAGTAGAVAIAGLAGRQVDNRDGADGAEVLECERGVFVFDVPAATHANIGSTVYATDDNTLTLDGTGGKLKAGTLAGIGLSGQTYVQF